MPGYSITIRRVRTITDKATFTVSAVNVDEAIAVAKEHAVGSTSAGKPGPNFAGWDEAASDYQFQTISVK